MAYTVDQVKNILVTDLGMPAELTSIAARIVKARDPSKGTTVHTFILVSGIGASGIYENAMIGPYPALGPSTSASTVDDTATSGTNANGSPAASENGGRVIFGYPLDPTRQQAALAQLAVYVYAYLGDHDLSVQVGFREGSKDGSFADHVAVAGTMRKSTPTSWDRYFVVQEERELP